MQRVMFVLWFFWILVAEAQDTVLKLYRPYGDVEGQVSPQIVTKVRGSCTGQSQLIEREDAWHCIAKQHVYDPCFVKAGSNRIHALCLETPWSVSGVEITVSQAFDDEHHKGLDMSRTYPWAIELTHGEQCLAVYGGQEFDNMPIRYWCHQKSSLFGPLQRCKNPWRILKKTGSKIETVLVRKAWF